MCGLGVTETPTLNFILFLILLKRLSIMLFCINAVLCHLPENILNTVQCLRSIIDAWWHLFISHFKILDIIPCAML